MSIASLGMYDNPAIRPAIDHLWQAWRALFINSSSLSVIPPENLNREMPLSEQWQHPDLFLSQMCGCPYLSKYSELVTLVATPRYTHAGCTGHHYSSFIASACGASPALEEYQDKILAANSNDSLSGLISLEISLADRGWKNPFFSECFYTGAHANSMKQVANGKADLCCIDAVSWAFTCRADPTLVERLQIIDQTPLLPALPLVTSAQQSTEFVKLLQETILLSPGNPTAKLALDTLGIEGFDIVTDEQYAVILDCYAAVPMTLKQQVAKRFTAAQ